MKKWYSRKYVFTTTLYYMEDSEVEPVGIFTPTTNIGFIKKYNGTIIYVQTDKKVHFELTGKGIWTADSSFFKGTRI